MKYSYDLHIHSCLSPCGDTDMTPNNIVNMASLMGLDIIAVSDHNSALNLPAVFEAAKKTELLVVPAIEANSAEEVHVLCLFASLDDALACSAVFYKHLPPVINRPDIFGEQLILNKDDEPVGCVDKLLINAMDFDLGHLIEIVKFHHGICIPAHVDKDSYSIISNLGYIPPEYGFSCVEVKNPNAVIDFDGKRITDSDAHLLDSFEEPAYYLDLPEKTVSAVINALS